MTNYHYRSTTDQIIIHIKDIKSRVSKLFGRLNEYMYDVGLKRREEVEIIPDRMVLPKTIDS